MTGERVAPTQLDGCTCGGIGTTGSHRPSCQWSAAARQPMRYCPDGGKCHHGCLDDGVCFRVECCEPLSGTRTDDRWLR